MVQIDNAGHDEIIRMDKLLKVYEGVVEGKSSAQLAEEMNITQYEVRQLREDVANTMVEGYHEQIKYAKARANARMEAMFSSAYEKGKTDRHWMRLAFDIVKAQVALYEVDLKRVELAEKDGRKLNYEQVETVTITRTSKMYDIAHEAEWRDWANTDLGEFLQNDGSDVPVIDPDDLPALKMQLKEIEDNHGHLPEEEDDDDED